MPDADAYSTQLLMEAFNTQSDGDSIRNPGKADRHRSRAIAGHTRRHLRIARDRGSLSERDWSLVTSRIEPLQVCKIDSHVR
jgi:hypothetical protein